MYVHDDIEKSMYSMRLIESPLDRALKSSGFGSPESKHSVQGNNRLYTDKTLGGCIEIACLSCVVWREPGTGLVSG